METSGSSEGSSVGAMLARLKSVYELFFVGGRFVIDAVPRLGNGLSGDVVAGAGGAAAGGGGGGGG